MPEPVLFRHAVASDRDALVTLQLAAYEPNRAVIGGTPTPLTWDYGDVLERWQIWLAEDGDGLIGALILEQRADDLYIQSVAVAPRGKGSGIGNSLLERAEAEARRAHRSLLRLTANARLTFNIDWYSRKGFTIEHIETIGERRRVHMAKAIAACAEQSVRPAGQHVSSTNNMALGGA